MSRYRGEPTRGECQEKSEIIRLRLERSLLMGDQKPTLKEIVEVIQARHVWRDRA